MRLEELHLKNLLSEDVLDLKPSETYLGRIQLLTRQLQRVDTFVNKCIVVAIFFDLSPQFLQMLLLCSWVWWPRFHPSILYTQAFLNWATTGMTRQLKWQFDIHYIDLNTLL